MSRRRKKTQKYRDHADDRLAAETVSGYRALLDATALDAEVYTAELYGIWWREATLTGGDPDMPLDGMLEHARKHRGRDALAALTAAAYLADTGDMREAAADAAASLRDAGVAAPDWADALPRVTPGRCLLVRDAYGEETTAICEFERDGDRDALYAVIDHEAADDAVTDAWLTTDPDAIVASVTEQVAESDGLLSLTEVEPAEAAEAVRSGFAALDEAGEVPESEELVRFRAAVLARLRAMPGRRMDPPEQPATLDDAALAALRDDFLAGTDLPDTPAVRDAADLIVDTNQDLRIGPRRLDAFLHSGVPAEVLDEPAREAFPTVIVAWTKYVAARAGLPEDAVEPLVELATECGPHGVEPVDEEVDTEELLAIYLPELDELPDDEVPGPDTIADILTRRLFAVPDVPEGADPADEATRRATIAAEHPEYADVPDGALVDGVNAHMHLAVHEIIATQLWTNDPPQAWQAARRLLDAGHDRMDVLHTLAEVFADTIADDAPDDDYPTALDKL